MNRSKVMLPFFEDETYYDYKINSDISINHDQYLYGK